MGNKRWCEHLDKRSKYTTVGYEIEGEKLTLKIQTWLCPECGVHGADTEMIKPQSVGEFLLRRV